MYVFKLVRGIIQLLNQLILSILKYNIARLTEFTNPFFVRFWGACPTQISLLLKIMREKNKECIPIASFQHNFFFSNLHVYFLSGPEKEDVRVGGLGRVGVEVQP